MPVANGSGTATTTHGMTAMTEPANQHRFGLAISITDHGVNPPKALATHMRFFDAVSRPELRTAVLDALDTVTAAVRETADRWVKK